MYRERQRIHQKMSFDIVVSARLGNITVISYHDMSDTVLVPSLISDKDGIIK
jgi:hypothetical protein